MVRHPTLVNTSGLKFRHSKREASASDAFDVKGQWPVRIATRQGLAALAAPMVVGQTKNGETPNPR